MTPPRREAASPLPRWRSVRGRLLALALIAAIPIVVMAALFAQETFRETGRAALRPVYMLQGQALARYQAGTARVQALLTAVLADLGHSPSCGAVLRDKLARTPARFTALAWFDPAGAIRCQVDTAPGPASLALGTPLPGWFVQAHGGVSPALGRLADGRPVAAVAGPDGGVLMAALPPGWFDDIVQMDPAQPGRAVWLLDEAGTVVAQSGTPEARPSAVVMARLDAPDQQALLTRTAASVPYAYAATWLPDGWHLVVAYRATREFGTARRLLFLRLGELAVLIVAGLAAIVYGAEATFGKPLRNLSGAVRRWQAGGGFDPGPLTGAPVEVQDLARSFAGATAALREQEAQLVRAREKQDLAMLEVHHRVKNNLQIIASLLNLQASRIRVPEARAEFQAARDRVRALATLHRHLYSDGDLHAINMRSFLMELCGQLFQAMGETEGQRIHLSIEAPELRLSSDQAVPLALIVTEAVTNSVRYAFPGGRPGHVSVRLTKHDDVLDLEIEDDGVGIPAGQAETEMGMRDGIGLQLIRGFSRQLGASLAVEEGHGTRYAVRLPLHPASPVSAVDAGEG